jgi:hypothetical protein
VVGSGNGVFEMAAKRLGMLKYGSRRHPAEG